MTDEHTNDAGAAWQQASGSYAETLKAMQSRLMEAASAMAGMAVNAAAAATAKAKSAPGPANGNEGHHTVGAAEPSAARIEALTARVERIEQVLGALLDKQVNGARGKRAKKKARKAAPQG